MIIRSIREVIAGRKLEGVAPDATVRAACRVLVAADAGALAVMEGDRLVGILGEHDVIEKCVAGGRRTDETRVADIMTRDPVLIDAERSLADALELMTGRGIRHLPVIAAGRVVGILSMRDIPTEYRLMAERFAEYRQAAPEPAMA